MPASDKTTMPTTDVFRTPETQRIQPLTEPPQLALRSSATTTTQKRCVCCPKKLTLTDFECGKCKRRHCAAHRLPEQHDCCHDFRAEGASQLTAANPVVVATKVEKI